MASDASAPRPRRYRYPERGVFGGVCAGLAAYLGVDVRAVRLAAAVLAGAAGLGIALYVLAWAVTPVAPGSVGLRRPRTAWLEAAMVGVALVAFLAVLHHAGLHARLWVVWPVALGLLGLVLVWRPASGPRSPSAADDQQVSLRGYLHSPRARTYSPQLALGSALVAFAVAFLLHAAGALHSLGAAFGAVAVVATAIAVLIAPLLLRLGHSLANERAARIREQERADVAAHLHDSVLQTLALIQKRADDPRQVATLARRQERDLRRWLFARPGHNGAALTGDTVRQALERAVAEVEEMHGVPIESVIVGDQPLDARLDALVPAAREALTNAAKFAGDGRIDLYVEIDEHRTQLFVRDRGAGFDLDLVPEDRRGVRDSIVGRVERHGGHVAIRTAPGEGTEVELSMECVRA